MDADGQMDEIAWLNDEFRRSLTDGYVVLHRTIRHWIRVCEVLDGLRVVPGGADEPLRDTGDVHVDGQRIVWKIHYYEKLGRFRCRPLDADCIRVLTAMFANGFEGSAREFWNGLEVTATREALWNRQQSATIRQRLRQRMTTFAEPVGV